MSGTEGKRGDSQEEDQVLLYEPVREVPRPRSQTMETPPADHQNSHHHSPGKPRRDANEAVTSVCVQLLRHAFPSPVGVFRPEQPDGGQL